MDINTHSVIYLKTPNDVKLMRVRFKANPDDYRPILWPIEYPYWCTGSGDGYSVMVAYIESTERLLQLWPEASEINIMEEDLQEFTFTDRFAPGDWFTKQIGLAHPNECDRRALWPKLVEVYRHHPDVRLTAHPICN